MVSVIDRLPTVPESAEINATDGFELAIVTVTGEGGLVANEAAPVTYRPAPVVGMATLIFGPVTVAVPLRAPVVVAALNPVG